MLHIIASVPEKGSVSSKLKKKEQVTAHGFSPLLQNVHGMLLF